MLEHEIRLALVMNGGVSLAVWMAGVTHEIDLIRRASGPSGAAPREHDQEVARRWRELLRPADGQVHRRVVVDVVAGTSAGGLNGAMLATAIAHDTTLDPADPTAAKPGPWLREQWCQLGALEDDKLIPSPGDRPGSVLDGGFFRDKVVELLGTLATGGSVEPVRHRVTLFTTASGLGRQGFRAQDAAGQPFDVPDHRFLYRFSNDKPSMYAGDGTTFREPEHPGAEFVDTETIGIAARASASFPVAFASIQESESLNKVRPPRERPRRTPTDPSWLVDGGVLDNAPFGPVLDVIARASVDRHANRYVVYVVPSSGIGQGSTVVHTAVGPGWTKTAMSAVQYPREVDFRGDVEELEGLLADSDAAWSDTQRLFDLACRDEHECDRVRIAATQLQPAYVRGRCAGGVWEALSASRSRETTVLDKSAAVTDADVLDILRTRPAWVPGPDDPFDATTGGAPLWPWGVAAAERVVRLILRRIRGQLASTFVRRTTESTTTDSTTTDSTQDDRQIGRHEARLSTASDVLRNVIAVRDAVNHAIRRQTYRPETTAGEIAARVNTIFGELNVQAALGQEIQRLRTGLPDGAEQVLTALAVEVVTRCTTSRTADERSAPFGFLRFGPNIALPMLDTAHQQVAAELGDRILYGTQVGHFGAFGAESWRRWDWLLGRLHAVAHLGGLLHEDGEAARAWVGATQRAVLAAEGWDLARFNENLTSLGQDFPPEAQLNGLGTMLDALNEQDRAPGRRPAQTVLGIADRLIEVSGKRARPWVQAAAGREHVPTNMKERTLRWYMTPSRDVLWTRLTGGAVSPRRTGPPAILSPWLGGGILLAALVGLLLAAVWGTVATAVLAAASGVAIAAGSVVVLSYRWLNRHRRRTAARLKATLDKRLGGSG